MVRPCVELFGSAAARVPYFCVWSLCFLPWVVRVSVSRVRSTGSIGGDSSAEPALYRACFLISAGLALLRAPPVCRDFTGTIPGIWHYSTGTKRVPLLYLLRYAPCEKIFVTALLHSPAHGR